MDSTLKVSSIVIQTPTDQFPLRVFDTPLCFEITRMILEGKTYPMVNVSGQVRVVLDVGANIGAAAVFFGLQFPQAEIWCFEPCPAAFDLLRQNAARLPNLRPQSCGLYLRDCEAALHLGREDLVTSSLGASYLNGLRSSPVQLRNAAALVRELGLAGRIDILKIDTEGCEVPILQALSAELERVSPFPKCLPF